MENNLKRKIIAIVGIIGTLLIFIFYRGLGGKPENIENKKSQDQEVQQTSQDENKDIITSTKPSPLNEATILASQNIEVTFNYPIQNIPEFKHRIDPKLDYKIELSSDRKTVKIIPAKQFELGTAYTLYIQPGTKFDGRTELDKEILYHFRTVNYTGI